MDKAGGYAIQREGSIIVEQIEGCSLQCDGSSNQFTQTATPKRRHRFMGLYYLVASFFFLLSTSLASNEIENLKSHLVYMSQSGNIEGAIDLYRKLTNETGEQDYELLTQLALSILTQGSHSSDPEEKLLTYFGAGLGLNEKTIPILESGLYSKEPKLQLVCLNFLSELNSDQADQSINTLFRNPNPLLQLEATFCMAKKKHPLALAHAEALLSKFPKELKPIFPTLFAAIGSPRSNSILRQLLNDTEPKVRLETLLVLTDHHRDDFLPQIRRLSMQTPPLQQEVTATALGVFADSSSTDRLKELVHKGNSYTCVAAAHSLYNIGLTEYSSVLIDAAKQEFPFGIALLQDVEEGREVLYKLTQSNKSEVRLNATISLLKLGDQRVAKPLQEILLKKDGNLIVRAFSPGKSMSFYRYVPYHQLDEEQGAIVGEVSKSIRARLLEEALFLPEEDFLKLARSIFNSNQNDLVPLLVKLLENMGSDPSVALLKDYEQKVGDPLVRAYCCLALYRLNEEGPYEKKLRDLVQEQFHVEMIQFKPFIPQEARVDIPAYELNPKESSQLYVEILESLTRSQEADDILTLLDAIQRGNKKNRYALAGLLMRAVK